MNDFPLIAELGFYPSPDALVAFAADHSQAVFLDSACGSQSQRYSYLVYQPQFVLQGDDEPWQQLTHICREFGQQRPDFFCGGLVGYLAYENFSFLKKVSTQKKGPIPNYWFGYYDAVLVIDHQTQKAFASSLTLTQSQINNWRDEISSLLQNSKPNDELEAKTQLLSKPEYSLYKNKIEKIKNYLKAGDIYQANYTERFEAQSTMTAANLYRSLRLASPSPYAAFINAGDFCVMSASPESFVEVKGRTIVTRPIKGTRKRDAHPEQDARLKHELLESQKDKAELLMIVDLERNDLGQVCEFGSVTVEELFNVETFAQVHHLVATVKGQLKKDVLAVEALKALFPGGSITGAPKLRAMQIIEELEDKPRSVYTGALGYLGNGGISQFNMPIRTLTQVGKNIYFHAGGGIVMDSEPQAEYEEMMVKASGMKKALVINENIS